MTHLLVGNVAPGTSDDEIRAFMKKYGFPEFEAIEHVVGNGSRPAVMLTFEHTGTAALIKLKERIHHVFWKRRKLTVIIVGDHLY
jgi:hypothetical protein